MVRGTPLAMTPSAVATTDPTEAFMIRSATLAALFVLLPLTAAAQTPPPDGARLAPVAAPPVGYAPAPLAAPVYAAPPPPPYYYYPPPYYPSYYAPPAYGAPYPLTINATATATANAYSIPAAPRHRDTGPRLVPYAGGPVPEGAKLVDKHANGWIVAGASTFGALYVTSILYAAAACPPGAQANQCKANTAWLYVPAIGPFLTAADPAASYGGRNLAVFDGVFQIAGIVAMIGGYASTERMLEYREGSRASGEHASARRWMVAPGAPGAATGLSFAARL